MGARFCGDNVEESSRGNNNKIYIYASIFTSYIYGNIQFLGKHVLIRDALPDDRLQFTPIRRFEVCKRRDL